MQIRKHIAISATLPLATLALVWAASGWAQYPDTSGAVQARSITIEAPQTGVINDLDSLPVLTEEQQARSREMLDRALPGGPVLAGNPLPETSAPAAVTGSRREAYELNQSPAPTEAAGNFSIYRSKGLRPFIAKNKVSNVAEISGDMSGKNGFLTGNWFAARTNDGGQTWTYINPYNDMPDFCCDQRAIYDPARDIFLWVRMGVPDVNDENRFRLSVSKKQAFSGAYWSYDVTPAGLNGSWTGEFFDYTEMQLTADHLYITWNLFSNGMYTRSVIVRFNLDQLAAGGAVAGGYLESSNWATVIPVAGADHTMWLASNWPTSAPQNSRLRIFKWDDDSGTVSFWNMTVTAWTQTNRYDAQCGSAGGNWLERTDQRLQTGARYRIQADNIKEQGRNVIAWWWNVAQGGSFVQPYIEAAAFYEDDLSRPAAPQDRPFVWSSEACFGYPSVAPNARGDLGMVFHYGNAANAWRPDIGLTLSDDYTSAPPGWTYHTALTSVCRPGDKKWGDYNTVRNSHPGTMHWFAGAHLCTKLPSNKKIATAETFFFGRERDFANWRRWNAR